MTKSPVVLAICLAFAFVMIPGALAATPELSVSTGQQPSDSISVCPDSVISDIQVSIRNMGADTDTIKLTLDWPADLGFIQPYVTLASGESKTVSPFWLTIPYNLNPGTYYAKITAESSLTKDKVTKEIEIDVMKCHSVALSVQDASKTSCRETEEPVTYDVNIRNDGKFTETFALSASVNWAEFSDSSVTLDAGESTDVSLVLTPPEGLPAGPNTVFVTARSTESYATASTSVEVTIDECFGFSVNLDPESQTTCLGEGKDYDLIITNTGQEEDEYSITVPDFVFPANDLVTVAPGESLAVKLSVVPEDLGIHTFDASVQSVRNAAAEAKTVSGIISVEECRGVAVIVAPSSLNICRGAEDAVFTVSVKNTGSVSSTFELTSAFGELEYDSIDLEGGQSKTVTLTVGTSGLPPGELIIDVSAQDGPVKDTASVEINVEECYSVELSLQPDEVSVCQGASIPYTIKVKNTGKETDTYVLDYGIEEKEITLQPEETQTISYTFDVPYVDEGRYLFTVDLASDNGVVTSQSSEITMKASGDCYGVVLEDGFGNVEVGKATALEINITNTGDQSDTFEVSVKDGPDWVFLEPTEISLGGKETGTIYLYMSPGFGTEMGEYTIDLNAKSGHSEAGLDIHVTVPEDVSEEPPETPSSSGDGENISINVTIPSSENETGTSVTGSAIEDRPFWKTAAVALIALIIVAILVLRFVLLLKK
jgi:uncharacterized membrane protein